MPYCIQFSELAFFSSSSLDRFLDLHRCLLAQTLQQLKNKPRYPPWTYWNPWSGTGGRSWNLLRECRGRSQSSSSAWGSPGRSRRCGTRRCWTALPRGRAACPRRTRPSGSWCCPAARSTPTLVSSGGTSWGTGPRASPGGQGTQAGPLHPPPPHCEQKATLDLVISVLMLLSLLWSSCQMHQWFCDSLSAQPLLSQCWLHTELCHLSAYRGWKTKHVTASAGVFTCWIFYLAHPLLGIQISIQTRKYISAAPQTL